MSNLPEGRRTKLRSDYHCGTTWGLMGKTPIGRTTGTRTLIQMISAIGLDGTAPCSS